MFTPDPFRDNIFDDYTGPDKFESRGYGAANKREELFAWHPLYTMFDYKKGEVTIFGAKAADLRYNYTDRFFHFEYDTPADRYDDEGRPVPRKYRRYEEAEFLANLYEPPRSVAWVELYLSILHTRDVEVGHIMTGIDHYNGYPYRVYGYRFI